MRFMGCSHATTLDLAHLRGEGPEPGEDSEDAALLQKQGDSHEAAHLARLNAAGRGVVEIARGDLATNAETTRAALAAGPEVVFQGAILSGNWGGWSDFLERVDRPSALGSFSYEVADTKLKRRPHPKHVLQLVLYSDLLTEIQGVAPEYAHVELGTGERATLRLADYAHYARAARARLEQFVSDPQPTRPIPCADCGLCRWAGHCDSVWQAEDSLFNVANISRGQVKKLEAAGITTMVALAGLDRPVRGMAEGTRLRLVTQARLQHARKTGAPAFELRDPEPGKGFDLLPAPQSGDIFYDIEGDPHYEGGLEYLHGIWIDGQFRSFWAHDHAAEARALTDLLELFRARLEEHPLEAIGPVQPVKRSFARSYRFPPQETKLRSGKKATVPVFDGPPVTVSIEEMDRKARQTTIKAGPGKEHLLADRLTLHPDWPLDTKVIAAALRDVIADQCGPRVYRAVDDLLSRSAPRLTTGPLRTVADPVAGTIDAVGAMDETVLPIQGPPGTGKTYVTARAILSLVRKGARVGVTSNSHEAIRNVLMGCLCALEDDDPDLTLDLVHKTSGEDDGYPEDCPVRRTTSNDAAADGRHVVGATAWFFTRDENVQTFDWLFVDEAGQMGIANMAAMGRAARNIVLVGDPRQLPQVIQGAHPEPANLSCLDWMLGDHATVPAERGIFLPVSRRMHPEVCRFISDQVYEGRLTSHPDTARQAVTGTSFPAAGAFWSPVPHEGNAQIASEEVVAIQAAARDLLSGAWTEKDSPTRPMRQSDIIVVAPYNAQVNALRDALPEGIRVGTVDKFQGQEAPVCLVSMTASSAEETPRGMDFLFSLNRINVAVSRAKGLALVFGAPRLREAKCETVEQMRLVNTLCALQVFESNGGCRAASETPATPDQLVRPL